MNTIQSIRKRLGMSQVGFASAIGMTQGSVSHMERGRHVVMPDTARRIIVVAAERGVSVTLEDIYEPAQSPKEPA